MSIHSAIFLYRQSGTSTQQVQLIYQLHALDSNYTRVANEIQALVMKKWTYINADHDQY